MISESQIIKKKIDKLNKLKANMTKIFPILNKFNYLILFKRSYTWRANVIMTVSCSVILLILLATNSELRKGVLFEFMFIISFSSIFIGYFFIILVTSLIDLALTPLNIPIFFLLKFIYYLKIKGLIQKYLSIKLNEYQSQGYDISELEDIKELIK